MEFSRRSILRAFAACTITAAPVYGNAAGFLKGAGDVRKLWLYSRRSGEEVETVYWVDGEYIDEGILEISRLMRDWRLNEIKIIDRRTFILCLLAKQCWIHLRRFNCCQAIVAHKQMRCCGANPVALLGIRCIWSVKRLICGCPTVRPLKLRVLLPPAGLAVWAAIAEQGSFIWIVGLFELGEADPNRFYGKIEIDFELPCR